MASFLSTLAPTAANFHHYGVCVDPSSICGPTDASLLLNSALPLFRQKHLKNLSSAHIVSHTCYISDPLLKLPNLSDIILGEQLLSTLSSFLNDKPILTRLQVQQKVLPHSHGILPHSDFDQGIGVIIYLTEANIHNGSTHFCLGSHHDRPPSYLATYTDATYYKPQSLLNYISLGPSGFTPGTTVIFDRSIVHSVPPYTQPGRIIVLAVYHAESIASRLHPPPCTRLTSSYIRTLTYSQRSCLGLNLPLPSSDYAPVLLPDQQKGLYKNSLARQLFWLLRYFIYRLYCKLSTHTTLTRPSRRPSTK